MRYEYDCGHCGDRMTLRRSIDEMDDPVESLCCGAPATRVFSVSRNIHIPISFQQVRQGGAAGGGQYSWSDFHEVSEKELAHLRDADGKRIEVVPYSEAQSQHGHFAATQGPSMGEIYNEVRQMPEGMVRELASSVTARGANDAI